MGADSIGAMAFWLAVGGIGIAGLLGPLGQAIARRISHGKTPSGPGIVTGEVQAERVALLEERLGQLEGERNQLEERLDFAERMLAQGQISGPRAGG